MGYEMASDRWFRIVAGFIVATVIVGCGDSQVDDPTDAVDELEPADPVDEEPGEDLASGSEDAATAAEGSSDGEETGSDDDGDEGAAADEDPYAIPEEGIDEAYMERVLEAIYEVNREALELTLNAEPGLVPELAESRLRSIYQGSYGARQYQALAEVANSQDLRNAFLEPLGSLNSKKLQLLDDNPDCIRIKVQDDFSAVLIDPPPPSDGYLAIAPKADDRDPDGLNPAPWVIADGDQASAESLSCD